MSNAPIDLAEKLSSFTDHWSPKVVARLNDYEIKVVKVQGEFVWHAHDDTDELFLVVDGELTIQLRDGNVALRQGQLFVVPRGVEHCPIAAGEVHAILIEPVGVLNTGAAGGPLSATTTIRSHSHSRAESGSSTGTPNLAQMRPVIVPLPGRLELPDSDSSQVASKTSPSAAYSVRCRSAMAIRNDF